MRKTTMMVIFNEMVFITVCPYCHQFNKNTDDLVLFYYCPSCDELYYELHYERWGV